MLTKERLEVVAVNRLNLLEAAAGYFQSRLGGWQKYLDGRGVIEESASHFRLGYEDGRVAGHFCQRGFDEVELYFASLLNEKGNSYFCKRLIFPILDLKGKVVGFVGRATEKWQEDSTKYLKSRDLVGVLYNMPALKAKQVFVTEGPLDAISLEQLGLPAVGVLSTHLSKEAGKHLEGKELVFVMDGDEPGREATTKLLERFPEAKGVHLPTGEDVNSLYVKDKRFLVSLLCPGK